MVSKGRLFTMRAFIVFARFNRLGRMLMSAILCLCCWTRKALFGDCNRKEVRITAPRMDSFFRSMTG